MNNFTQRHINSYIHSILSLLKKQQTLTFNEVELHLKINLFRSPELMKALHKNCKIKVCNGYLEYIPSFTFTNVDELLSILKGGIDIDNLTDMNEEKMKIVYEAEKQGKIYIIRDSENLELIFPNDFGVIKISDSVKDMYKDIKVPNYQDVLNELAELGVRKNNPQKVKHILIRKKKIKQYKRRIKITNTHVKDLNWSEKD
ncbi:General transcription factor IIE subunit 2 [Dictyocoela muelleri]|nr:General transcription factor IIE subunit 2 [Dictyocoela muelleri]